MARKAADGEALPSRQPSHAVGGKSAQRIKICAFDARAAERQALIRRSPALTASHRRQRERLKHCSADDLCRLPDRCGACAYAALAKARKVRVAFERFCTDHPEFDWSMTVAISEDWQYPVGRLTDWDPRAVLEQVAQLCRRAHLAPVIIGVDLSLNTAQRADYADYVYWQGHLNVLVPCAHKPALRDILARFCLMAPTIPRPIRFSSVNEPWVAANYTFKFAITGLIGKYQEYQELTGSYVFRPWRYGRISQNNLNELVAWRAKQPLSALAKMVGVGVTPSGWKLLE